MACKTKLWKEDSIKEAVGFVESGSSLYQAANVTIKTLRRHFNEQ